ncbi:MAG TPA: dephospho-CoA kinase [Burkholderiales bacterium]|nr:dephospho-CoA kinase [Burkholderiales bacterium]
MYCVGLTGGIGSGKSSAADEFAALGAALVDSDAISHELTRAGGAAIAALREEFGADYITPEGALDRSRMRALVFADAHAKRRLEAVLHPLIRQETTKRIATAHAPYVVLVVPLLLETGAYRELVQRIVVVDCSEATQIARVMARSGLAENEVRAIMATQISRADRLARADDVIRNDGDRAALREQVRALHQRYLAFAASPRKSQ